MARPSPGPRPRDLSTPTLVLVAARVVGALLAYLGVLSILVVGLSVLGLQVLADTATGVFGLVAVGIAYAAALATVLALWRYVDHRPIVAMGFARQYLVPQSVRGTVVAAVLMCTIVLVSYGLLGGTWSVNPDPVRATLALVVGLVGFILQGSSEEVLFRGYILENIRTRWGDQWAIAGSAGAFAMLHSLNPEFDLLPLANLLLFGIVAGYYKLYVDGGQMWGVCAIHAIWNWLQQVVFGLPNSGTVPPPENTLFSIQPNQSLPDLAWGGGFGPEGTLAATLVLLALLGYIMRRRGPAARSVTP